MKKSFAWECNVGRQEVLLSNFATSTFEKRGDTKVGGF